MTLLLIYPPFAMPDKPYISLPVLAAHLEAMDIPVSCWDANLAFFRKRLSPAALEGGGGEEEKPPIDLFREPSLGNRERLDLFGRYLDRIGSADESLSLTGNTGYLRYHASPSFFSSEELIRAARQPGSLTRDTLGPEAARILEETDPVLAGISVAFPDQILPALTLAARIKEIRPDLPVILGGAFVTIHMKNPGDPALFDLVDALVLGDGEPVLPALYKAAREGRLAEEIAGMDGVIFRGSQGHLHGAEPVVHPMAGAPAPAYTRLPLDDYLVPRARGAVLFRLSRGCYWGRCAFCNSLSPIIRSHDQAGYQETWAALTAVLDQTGAPVVHFTDDAADPGMLEFLAERLLAERRHIQWTVNVRVDKRLSLSLLSRMCQAGCFSLFIGVESCCDRVLRKMNKGTSLKQIDRLLTDLSWAGISANIYMITGFPTETRQEAEAGFAQVSRWLEQGLVRQVIYNRFSLTPDSPVAADPESFGITDCPSPPGKDLAPPLSDFTCTSGMTREEASTLCAQINHRLSRMRNAPAN